MVPLGLFGIPLGLAGLGGVWSAARTGLGVPVWPEEILFGVSSALWVVLTATYLKRGLNRKGAFQADLKHPGGGPFASLIPLVGILLVAHYSGYLPAVGVWVLFALVAALAVVATQLLAHWVTGGVNMDSIHPGYFLPVVAGPFVASIGFTTVHAPEVALAAFGVGAFFWLVLGTVVTIRLMTGGPLPPSAVPALSAYLAAPATASVAWHIAHPGSAGPFQLGLSGVLVMMILMQVLLIGVYRKLTFSSLFWVFTFPVATTSNYAVRWLTTSAIPGREIYAWAILALASTFVLIIAGLTIASLLRGSTPASPEENKEPTAKSQPRKALATAGKASLPALTMSAAKPLPLSVATQSHFFVRVRPAVKE
ncbi:TDT family transporter [Paenarthrobacter sp. CM16]|nr:TDT family transporter [Paenarthrobacter sp. CM16]